jgi:hypothetical protein
MKDALGHGSNPRGNAEAADQLASGPKSAAVAVHPSQQLMSASQLSELKTAYSGIKTIDPSQPTYGKLIALLDASHPDRLKQLSEAGIPFVSNLARNRLPKTGLSSDPSGLAAMRKIGTDFSAKYGSPRDHAAEQRGFNSGKREIARLRRQGK